MRNAKVLIPEKAFLARRVVEERIWANLHPRKDRSSASLHGVPLIQLAREGGNWRWPDRISLQALRRCDRRPEIQEWIHIDLIKEDANSPAYNQIATPGRLISKANPRSEVIVTRGEDGIDSIPFV